MANPRYPGISANERRRLRRSAWDRQGGMCFYCGFKMDYDPVGDFGATLDHRMPVALGGTWDEGNIAMACRLCNEVKGDTPETQFRALLAKIKAGWFSADPRPQQPQDGD